MNDRQDSCIIIGVDFNKSLERKINMMTTEKNELDYIINCKNDACLIKCFFCEKLCMCLNERFLMPLMHPAAFPGFPSCFVLWESVGFLKLSLGKWMDWDSSGIGTLSMSSISCVSIKAITFTYKDKQTENCSTNVI